MFQAPSLQRCCPLIAEQLPATPQRASVRTESSCLVACPFILLTQQPSSVNCPQPFSRVVGACSRGRGRDVVTHQTMLKVHVH